jgi:hypothetical protein
MTRPLTSLHPRDQIDVTFSDLGRARLEEAIAEFASALVAESSSRSRRHRADIVSAHDVEDASDGLLRSSRRSSARYFGAIGGVLFGAALSNALAMGAMQSPSRIDITLTAAIALVGVAGILFQVARRA